jgi:pimeloyl-ACP methyl ester carboxylesterase
MPKITSRDGTTIAYDKKGHGPMLFLVLGALNRKGQGKKLTEQLCNDFTVVSYDRRGKGESSDMLPYTTDKEVDDIAALLNELGDEAYIYGHSSGCILALLAAQKLGDAIKGLALYELPYDNDPAARAKSKEYQEELARLLVKDKRADAVALFVKSVGVTDKQIAAMKRLPMWRGLTAMAPTLAYDTIELMEHYPTIDLKSIYMNTLVMYGGDSPKFMKDTANYLASKLPSATVRQLEDQTHDVKADALAPVLKEFFQSY